MKYHRYGHCEGIKVKVGDRVKKGQLIAKNGTGNGQWMAHCHYDILTYLPKVWTEYCIEKSKDWVKAHYADPRGNEKIVMPTFHHLGLGWLEYWDYDSQSKKTVGAKSPCFHPGLDLNGPGSGNADLDDPLHSACDGIVAHVYSGTSRNAGWGDMIVIEEIVEESKIEAPIPKVDEVVPIPIKIEVPAEPIHTYEEPEAPAQEVKSEVVPVDWKFVIGKIIELIKIIFKK